MNLISFFSTTYFHADLYFEVCWIKVAIKLCDHKDGYCVRDVAAIETAKDEADALMQHVPGSNDVHQRDYPSEEDQSSSISIEDGDITSKKLNFDNAEGLASPLRSPYPRHCRRLTIHFGFFCTLALIFMLVLIIYILFTSWQPTASSSLGLGSSSTNPMDYILDANWEFSAESTRREYHWTISDMQLNPDGIYRPMLVINKQFPGPLIECNEGDTIVVHVDNQAVNSTSIHWHGLFQNGTNYMDGTIGVTQCPIAPGHQYTYEFTVQGQSGTYWYHGHNGLQALDGLLGPFIIHSPEEKKLQKLTYSTDRVLMIQDHYHDLSGQLLMTYLRPDQENIEPVPDGALINGRNIRNCDDFSHRVCDNTTAGLPHLDLKSNEAHRIRIINVGTFAEFQLQIDEHEFAVTEVDGTDVLPAYYHRLNIQPAQRYSIVLSTNVSTSDLFWLRARMITYCFSETNPHLEPEIRAVVKYRSKTPMYKHRQPQSLPSSKDWSETVEVECKDMNVSNLVPVERISPPPVADAFFYLRSNFEIGAWRLSRGFFNSTSWRPSIRSPILARAINGLASDNSSFNIDPPGAALNDDAFDVKEELVIQTSGIQTIDIAIQNFDDGSHPMHLHGYKFFVLGTGDGHFNASKVYPDLDLSNPLRRDTASLESYSWLLIRLVADNPGAWALHCHVSWHTEAGLLMTLLTRSDVLKRLDLPDDNKELCNARGLEKGAGPKDEIWFGDFGG